MTQAKNLTFYSCFLNQLKIIFKPLTTYILSNKSPFKPTQLLLSTHRYIIFSNHFPPSTMSYQYRSIQPKSTPQPPIQLKTPEFPPPRSLTKQQLKNHQSLLILISHLLKSNLSNKIKHSFNKLKTFVNKKKKYSQLLAKKIHFLTKNKQREYTFIFFSSLVANKISSYNQQMATLKSLKSTSKNRSIGIIFHSLSKLYTKKYSSAFNDLKSKSLTYSKARIFKTTHMFARLSLAYRHKLQGAFNKLAKNKGKVAKNGKILGKLESFFSVKNKRNLISAFNRLKTNLYKLKLAEASGNPQEQVKVQKTETKPVPGPVKNVKTSNISVVAKAESQKKQLEQRSKQLQSQITQLEQASSKNLTSLKNQIARLQKDNQALRFNNDLLQQNNTQMQRDIQAKQLRARKKLSKNEIWENVYNNLIYFLGLNRNKTITKEQLIECLETPLVPCNTNLEELNEENKVLADLLTEYKKSFPEPENKNPEAELTLPYDLLKKKNRYYYQVLEVLSEWGLSGSSELNQLNQDLEALQKKLVE